MKFKSWWLALIVLAIFCIPFFWLTPGQIIIGGDLTLPLHPGPYFESIWQIWRRVYAGTNSAISLTTVPFYLPMAILDWIGLSLPYVEAAHFGLWLALPAITMYYLTGVIFGRETGKLPARLVTTGLYLFNTYQVVWADSARMAVWVGLPLILGLLHQGLEAIEAKKSWLRLALGIGASSLILSTAAVNPPIFIMFSGLIAVFLANYLFSHRRYRELTIWQGVGKFLAAAIGSALAINSFWLVPFGSFLLAEYRQALTGGLGGINLNNWLDPLSTNTSLFNVLRLQGAWDWYAGWNGEEYVPVAAAYQNNPWLIIWSVAVPILAVAGYFLATSRWRRLAIIALGITTLGLILSAGTHPPTGDLYKWLTGHLPFFSIFRSPWYKFTTWTVFGYALLTGIFFLSASERWPKFNRWLGMIALFVCLANFGQAYGLVAGKIFPHASERRGLDYSHVGIPRYFYDNIDFINRQEGDWRILQLPATPSFRYNFGLNTLMDMTIFALNKPTFWWPEQIGTGPAQSGVELLVKKTYEALYRGEKEKFQRLTQILNIGQLLQKDDIDYKFYSGQDTPEFVKGQLKAVEAKLVADLSPWQLYQPQATAPSLFTTANSLVRIGDQTADYLRFVDSPYFTTAAGSGPGLDSVESFSSVIDFVSPVLEKIAVSDEKILLPLPVSQTGRYHLPNLNYAKSSLTILKPNGERQPLVIDGQTQLTDLELQPGKHQLELVLAASHPNLINDGSFETGLWERPIDASIDAPGRAQLGGLISQDSRDGRQSAELFSRSHSAAIRRSLNSLNPKSTYLISFKAKSLSGQGPGYAVYQLGSLATEPALTVEAAPDRGWQNVSFLLQPKHNTTEAQLFLYAHPPTDEQAGGETRVRYDQVKAQELPEFLKVWALSTTALAGANQTTPTPSTPAPTVKTNRINSGLYQIEWGSGTPTAQPFVLIFNEKFDPKFELWTARNGQRGQRLDFQHFVANGYANGWIIEPAKLLNSELILSYQPQRQLNLLIKISGLALLATLSYLIYSALSGRTNAKGRR